MSMRPALTHVVTQTLDNDAKFSRERSWHQPLLRVCGRLRGFTAAILPQSYLKSEISILGFTSHFNSSPVGSHQINKFDERVSRLTRASVRTTALSASIFHRA